MGAVSHGALADITDEGRSDVSFASWEQKRMKDDIRSFLKQILLEVRLS